MNFIFLSLIHCLFGFVGTITKRDLKRKRCEITTKIWSTLGS